MRTNFVSFEDGTPVLWPNGEPMTLSDWLKLDYTYFTGMGRLANGCVTVERIRFSVKSPNGEPLGEGEQKS